MRNGWPACGLRRGDRVALVAENTPEWTAAFLAILKAGGTAVLLDASLLPDDLLRQIVLSDVRCLFFSPRVIKKMSTVVPRDLAMLDLSRDGELFGDNARSLAALPPTADGDESVAAIIYSSGTTRAAAGIMHSHDALIETTLMCARSNKLTAKGKYLAVVPNSHIYGLICSVLGPMLLGADVRFIEMGTAAAIVKAFAEYRPTVFPCVPRVFELFKSELTGKSLPIPRPSASLIFFSRSACRSAGKRALTWANCCSKPFIRDLAAESRFSVQPARLWTARRPSFISGRASIC